MELTNFLLKTDVSSNETMGEEIVFLIFSRKQISLFRRGETNDFNFLSVSRFTML